MGLNTMSEPTRFVFELDFASVRHPFDGWGDFVKFSTA